jgi:hypothetical protein
LKDWDVDAELAAILAASAVDSKPHSAAYEWLKPGALLASANFTLAVVSTAICAVCALRFFIALAFL